MPGPAPLPTKIKQLTGNRGKRALNKKEPEPSALISKEPPDHLNEVAKEEWRRIIVILDDIGVMTQLDVSALEMYCQNYSILREASEDVKENGLLVTGDNQIAYQNPNLKIMTEYSKLCRSFLQEFGMTPAARTRVHTTKEKAKKSKFDDI
jgi:P27 family predicted phage terminase small subunit